MHGRQHLYVLSLTILVSVGGILYGYDIGVISGALLFIQNSISLTDTQTGLIVAAVLAGGLLGTLLAGPIADYYGRRFLIFLASVIFILGVSFILIANEFWILFLARLFLGVGVGIIAVAVPLYIAEMVPNRDRGKYVTFFQLLLTLGIVLAYCSDYFFSFSGNWRGMFGILLIPSFILFFGIFILPESPRWLIAKNKHEKAKHTLKKIRLEIDIEKEINEIALSLKELKKNSWRELLTYQLLLPSFIAIAIAIFNQLTGINSFLQYAPLILKNAGINSNAASMLGSVGIGVLNLFFTVVAILLIDTIGRRPLLLIGIGGVAISEIYLGIINYFMPISEHSGILSLIGLLFFIAFFAIGPGVVVWLAISELFPTPMRGKGISVCLFFNSLAATLLAIFFLPFVKQMGVGVTYWLFASFSLVYFLIVYFFLPETKSQSLETIQNSFFKKTISANIK